MFTRLKKTWSAIRITIGNRKVLSMLLTIIPISDVWAAPAVTRLRAVALPVYLGTSTGISNFMHVSVMQDPDTGNPIYCTHKGSTLPANSFALDMAFLCP